MTVGFASHFLARFPARAAILPLAVADSFPSIERSRPTAVFMTVALQIFT